MKITNRFTTQISGQAVFSLLAWLLPVVLLGLFAGIQLVDIDQTGLSTGFSHPLMGFDHLLTMLAVGVWAAQMRGHAIWQLPLTFVGVMSLGGIAGAAGLDIPVVEGIILLSCAVFSVLITRRIRFSAKVNVLLVAFFAFFHGYAHGQEISTSASLLSYTAGFMLATLLLHGAGILIAKLVVVAISGLFAILISTSSQAAYFSHEKAQESFALKLMSNGIAAKDQWYLAESWGLDDGGGCCCVQSHHEPSSNQNVRAWQELGASGFVSDCLQGFVLLKNQQAQETQIFRRSFKTGFPAINHTPGLAIASSGVGRASPPLDSSCIDLTPVQTSALISSIPRFSLVSTQSSRSPQFGFLVVYPHQFISSLLRRRDFCVSSFAHHFRKLC